uniref:ATP synthase subunit a n=1 Tax=Sclerotia substriata TaxID=1652676 RepID=A0A0U2BUE4_9COLE|nr:ATP synthase F0 subunit 6 [Sclerotia substriata]AKG95426.1 ATP synthase F0 subunit 6 [Sclerotia substriata]UZG66033.1 ATP synthase F0 subunit 6 [Sclerotia substriata]
MMTNLFSSFDPSTSMNLALNWMSVILGLMFMPTMFCPIPSRINLMWIKMYKSLSKESEIILKVKSMKKSTLIFVSLFSLILFSNFLSLFPYIFSSTSHLILTLTLSFPLWLSFMIYGWINNTIHMMAHLVPQGTPPVLMPFMVCIETISNIIRPGTLAIRLTANMIAGHLLLTLMGSTGSKLSILMLNVLILSQLLLLVLETAVAIIQSYVFSVLSTLYSSEVN